MPSDVTLECTLNKEDMEVEWFKDDHPLTHGKKYKISTKGAVYKLTVNDVNEEDDGQYTFKVKGKDLKSQAGLFVESECFVSKVCFPGVQSGSPIH